MPLILPLTRVPSPLTSCPDPSLPRMRGRVGRGEWGGARGLPRFLAALFVTAPSALASAETIPEPMALLQGLDKISARVSKFEAAVGTPVRFGTLSILVRDCEKNSPEETPE